MENTLLTAKELSQKIKYSATYINSTLRDSIFIEGVHYIRPFNARKVLYIWEVIEQEMYVSAKRNQTYIPFTSSKGVMIHG